MSNFNNTDDLIQEIKKNLKKTSLETRIDHPFTKKILWDKFTKEFMFLHNKEFLQSENIIENIKPIFYYFLQSKEFFTCENLRDDVSAPSFNKGLLLFGNVGVGKSHIMMVFRTMFKNYKPHRFIITPTSDVVDEYEATKSPDDRKHFFKKQTSATVLFDDLNSEKIANNFGHINIMKEIILRRHNLNKKTHLIMNPICGFENDINGSLLKLGENYDQRTVDRMYEMYNVIEFKGKSLRR